MCQDGNKITADREKTKDATCKSFKDWVQCLNTETGLLLWRTAARKKHHPQAQWIVWLKNPQTIFFGLTNCSWVAWSVASHLEMIEQICGAQSSWSQTCIMNMFRPMCYSNGSLAKSPWTPFHLCYGSSHWWLTRKVSNAGLGQSGVTRHFFHWNFKTSSYFTFSGLCFQPNLGSQGTGMTLELPAAPGVPCLSGQVGRYLLSPESRLKERQTWIHSEAF